MLPLTLLALILQSIPLTLSQPQPQPSTSSRLTFNSLTPFTPSTLPNPPTFTISPSEDLLTITIASCSLSLETTTRFFVSNDTGITNPGPDDVAGATRPGVGEVVLDKGGGGLGEWKGFMKDGGFLSVVVGGSGDGASRNSSFEIAVATTGATHTRPNDSFPLLGDTTSNQALLFSPPFSPVPLVQPTFPNYTLPSANLSQPDPPSDPPTYELFLVPTTPDLAQVPRTGCALRNVAAASAGGGGGDANTNGIQNALMLNGGDSLGLWLRDEKGWRWQWLVEGLTPQTNYTAIAISDGTKVSEDINLITKSGGFPCPLVHSLSFCPRTTYSIPLTAPSLPKTAHDNSTLPPSLTSPLLQTLTNFTVSLLTHPCGRDLYSPLVTCADCQDAYRRWLCAVSFPRCGEPRPDDPIFAQGDAQNQLGVSSSSEKRSKNGNDDYKMDYPSLFRRAVSFLSPSPSSSLPTSALVPQPTTLPPRSLFFPNFTSTYTSLLPCLETCTATDRACPIMLGFTCPVKKFTAAKSYGVGFMDSAEVGEEGGGSTGTGMDRWGNVWCNEG